MKRTLVWILTAVLMMTGASRLLAVSESAVLFLLISPGARASGMGEAFVAVADDATAVHWNPAGLAFQRGNEIIVMHCKWLPGLVDDMYYEFASYRRYFKSLGGTLGANITYLNMGEQVWMDEYNIEQGRFTSYDFAVSLSYATQLSDNMGLGVTMRYIQSLLAPDWVQVGEEKGSGKGNAFAVDLGFLYHNLFIKGLSLGANLSNMGPKITYVDAAQADPIPTNLKLGIAYKIMDTQYNRLTLAIDTNKLLVRRTEEGADPFYKAIFTSWSDGSVRDQMKRLITSVGTEYVYNNMIFLRAGYYYDEIGKVKFPAFGAGLQYHKYRFDFAYVAAEQGHPLSDTMRFSLSIGF
ncbi:MAG TPA: type IX secretion system outer membrane channel protein PorV [bacterium]|nr:type IX secretion system outer membrane channel protein PorV [bacterium]